MNYRRERLLKNKDTISEIWDNIKQPKIHTIGVSENGEEEGEPEKVFEKMITKIFNVSKSDEIYINKHNNPQAEKNMEEIKLKHIIIELYPKSDKE